MPNACQGCGTEKETGSSENPRVIGNLGAKHKIITDTMPIDVVLPCVGEHVTVLDKIVTVCCALTNMNPSVVLQKASRTVNQRSHCHKLVKDWTTDSN
jgi:hypothetical protein